VTDLGRNWNRIGKGREAVRYPLNQPVLGLSGAGDGRWIGAWEDKRAEALRNATTSRTLAATAGARRSNGFFTRNAARQASRVLRMIWTFSVIMRGRLCLGSVRVDHLCLRVMMVVTRVMSLSDRSW
jgi:hypothetical protein